MKEIEKIKSRIEKRKIKDNIACEMKRLESNKNSKLYNICMGIMTVYVLFMSFALYAKKDNNAVLMNSIFDTNVNFTKFNATLNKLINFRIVEENTPLLEDMIVSNNSVTYQSLGDDYYTSEGNLVVALADGVITYVNGKDYNYTIIVEYDNGIRATYNEINEVNVFVNDRVYQDDILGSFDDQVNIIFIKDHNKITYEEVIAFI